MLLLLSTIGFTVSKHYCCGELISRSLFVEADSCCESDDCCKNETEAFQFDEDFSVSPILELPASVQIDLLEIPLLATNLTTEGIAVLDDFLLTDSLPPPKTQSFLAIRQSFLL
jgi:hypothetical protein